MAAPIDRYIPALSFKWLTPLYDPLLKWGMREETFKRRLIAQARIWPGASILDLGCGTGTLTILVKQSVPDADVTGVDGDLQVLHIAAGKAAQAGVPINWDHALAFALPYQDSSFDRVLSSLVIHHLTGENKRKAFREVFRVLRPGGECHIVDFGPPHSPGMWLMSRVMRNLEEGEDNFDGRLPEMLAEAGFEGAVEVVHMSTLFGPISLLQAIRPSETFTVCGGKIKDPGRYPSAIFRGEMVHFCTRACLGVFESDPERFMSGEIEHPTDEDE